MKTVGWPSAAAALFSIHFIGTLQYAAPNSFHLLEYYTGLKLKSKLPSSVKTLINKLNITTCKKR